MLDSTLNHSHRHPGRATRPLGLLAAAAVVTVALSGCATGAQQAGTARTTSEPPAAAGTSPGTPPGTPGDGDGGIVGRWTVTSSEDSASGTVVQIAREIAVYRPCAAQADAAAQYAYVVASDGSLVVQATGDSCPGDGAEGSVAPVRWLEDATRVTRQEDGSLALVSGDGSTTAVLEPGGTVPASTDDDGADAAVTALWQSPVPSLPQGMAPATPAVLTAHPWYPANRHKHSGREAELSFETADTGSVSDGCTGVSFVYVLEDTGRFRSSVYATPPAIACPWKKVRLPYDLGTARAVATSDDGQSITLIDEDGAPIRTLYGPKH